MIIVCVCGGRENTVIESERASCFVQFPFDLFVIDFCDWLLDSQHNNINYVYGKAFNIFSFLFFLPNNNNNSSNEVDIKNMVSDDFIINCCSRTEVAASFHCIIKSKYSNLRVFFSRTTVALYNKEYLSLVSLNEIFSVLLCVCAFVNFF